MRHTLLVALLASCGSSSPSAGSSSGSASGSAPTSECPDAEIAKRGDAAIELSLHYMTELQSLAAAAGTDCEVARTRFLALEPEGTRFMNTMTETKAWSDTLSPTCGDRARERWEKSARAGEIEALAPKVQAAVTPLLERCQDHPGFKDAVAKGLRVMRKKQ